VKYGEFTQALERYGAILRQVLTIAPPDIDKPSTDEVWKLLKIGRNVRGLGKKDMMRLLRWGPMAVADLASEFFETELLRAAIAARGIYGAAMGPWSAGSTALLLLRAAADPHPAGSSSFPRGGMGALTQAMAAAATKAGAEIRTGADVERILIKDGVAAGLVLTGGEEISATTVISNADPRRTFLKLTDPVHLPPGFVVKMQNFRANGTVAKINLALDRLPNFTALQDVSTAAALSMNDPSAALSGRIHIGPSIDYLERAFDHSKYGEFSSSPYLDVTIPSLLDPGLAPEGKHVLSAYVQFAPFKLKKGNWDKRRKELGDTVIKTLASDFATASSGSSSGVCQQLQAAVNVYEADQQLVLQAAQVSDSNTQTKITLLTSLVAGTVEAITAVIPSCQTSAQAMKGTPPFDISNFAAAYNGILLAPTGNAAVDQLTPKLILHRHSKFVRLTTFGRLQ